jgi:Arc/MetJ-type ribon-helix-helix transcriptional regulator
VIGMAFDYDSPAELFIPRHKSIRRRQQIGYRRFATAAEAIRFAVEELPAVRTLGAWMQIGDDRFDSDEICQLYESSGYPLQRNVSR